MNHNPRKKQPELVITGDGSHTLFSPGFNQHYHNPKGAIAESRHVFFESNALSDSLASAKKINILETGFGTGLNLLLLLDEYLASGSTARIVYHSIEAWPISPETASAFNYREYIRHPGLSSKITGIFASLSPGYNFTEMFPGVETHIFYGLFDDYNSGDFRADYLFHDAFSPEVNKELWTGETFQKLKNCSTSDSLLTTYCAASKARGAMAWAGWHVARAPGVLGKREMTVASPNPNRLNNFRRVNEERLAGRYENEDFE